ncbi:2OG-Fe(II) oxygenase family protein [Shewanella surugensis]|uniref:2-oxoglutarate-dependent ethylene/succinate-forming enzyme n=1 Tax=Shewanella surugensis TaxID=212020 RepID=A0ABT0LBS3_9GAMM|nr:2OG-Fe(II) oxygenase family protein [Shewanella surugensis]MCL1125147.1 hypothetical protein [Shewanella surugensis]
MKKEIKTDIHLEYFDSMNWYNESSAPKNVPIIDLKGFNFDSKNNDIEKIKATIIECLKNGSGFFYIKNFGIEEAYLSEFLRVTGELFQMPKNEKEKLICPTLPLRGYTETNKENTALAINSGDSPDICMKYTWTQNNIYPNIDFKNNWDLYMDKTRSISRKLLELIRSALGEDEKNNQLWNNVINGEGMVRHLYYPDIPSNSEDPLNHNLSTNETPLRMGNHSDIGSITLLYQTPCPNGFVSLEAEIDDGFVGIPAIRNTMVVNIGDTLSIITGGEIKATKHRVLQSNHQGSERTATALFYFPSSDFDLKKIDKTEYQGLIGKINPNTFSDFLNSMSENYCNKNL